MKLLFLLRDLNCGGTQRQAIELGAGLRQRGHDITIATFYPGGVLAKSGNGSKVKVVSLDKRGRWDAFSFVGKLMNLFRRERPDLIYSMLDGPNLLAAITKWSYSSKLIWGIRSSYVDWSRYGRLHYITYKLTVLCSSVPNGVVFNSLAGLETHKKNGLKNRNSFVISNGIDTKVYFPTMANVQDVRTSWGAGPGDWLIGAVGRLDAMKDLPTLFRAVQKLACQHAGVKIVCIGEGEDSYRNELTDLVSRLGLAGHVSFIGYVENMREAYNALDILVSSSIGEGFSNVIGEAMACGTRCVVTDVGDSRKIVGSTGYVVPSGNFASLANGIEHFFRQTEEEEQKFSEEARSRIERNFSVKTMVDQTEETIGNLVGCSG